MSVEQARKALDAAAHPDGLPPTMVDVTYHRLLAFAEASAAVALAEAAERIAGAVEEIRNVVQRGER